MGNCICPEEKKDGVLVGDSSRVTTRSNLIFNTSNRDVTDYYEIVKKLGEGSMGSVTCVRRKAGSVGGSAYTTNKKTWFGRILLKKKKVPEDAIARSEKKLYALKSIIISRISKQFLEELKNEISILQSLDHPNIVKAYEVYVSKVNMYIVMEYCSGGDLYTRIPYSEEQSAKIVGKLLSAIAYMHEHNVSHRDIKFENIMFESKDEDAEVKLIDFGLSKICDPKSQYMTDEVGTIYTMAPQVVRGVYTSAADCWSMGVVTYMLLSNSKPFHGKTRRDILRNILKGKFSFYAPIWSNLTDESKDFIRSLIEVEPIKRSTAVQALKHPWLEINFPLHKRAPDLRTMESIPESMRRYGEVSEFKKMALMIIAHQSSTDEIIQLRKAFDQFDVANDGTINFSEFRDAIKSICSKYSDEDIENMFKSVDVGRDDKIYYLEFLASTLEVHGRITEERLAEAFDRMDSDDSGFISKENLMELMGIDYSEEKFESMMKDIDTDCDGKISFEEFMNHFRKDQNIYAKELRPVDEKISEHSSDAEILS